MLLLFQEIQGIFENDPVDLTFLGLFGKFGFGRQEMKSFKI